MSVGMSRCCDKASTHAGSRVTESFLLHCLLPVTVFNLLEPEPTCGYEVVSSQEWLSVALGELTGPLSALDFSVEVGCTPKFLLQVFITEIIIMVAHFHFTRKDSFLIIIFFKTRSHVP